MTAAGEETDTSGPPTSPATHASRLDVTHVPNDPPAQTNVNISSSFASDYNIMNSQNYGSHIHANHAAYLRSTMEKNLDAINHSIPRTSTMENEKIYFDGVTHAHSLSIQLAREKRRTDALTDELKSAKRELRKMNDSKYDSKNKLTRDINNQQHEISNMSGKIMDLQLELKKSIQEKREMQVEFKRYKRNFERQIEGYQRKSIQTINSAEDHLVQYNDEWTKRMDDERHQWIEKVRMREELSEHNMMALQNQFSEAHQFYTDHIGKLRKQMIKEEMKRTKVEEELEEVKSLLLREQAARKALTNQLKKERKWREKCINVTKSVMNLKAENNLDNGGDQSPSAPSPLHSEGNPYAEDPVLAMDPASVAYLQAVAEFEKTEHANATAAEALHGSRFFPASSPKPPPQPPRRQAMPQRAPYQSPIHTTNVVLEEERRKNKLLTLELLRQRAFHNSGLPSPPPLHADFSNLSVQIPSPKLSSPARCPPTSPYFPLGSNAGAVVPEEVAALRVAVERADVERVLEAEIGIEKDVELEHLRMELEQERNKRSKEAGQVEDLKMQIDKAVQEEREQLAKEYHDMLKQREALDRERERQKDEKTKNILQSSTKMHEALQQEKAEHSREREEYLREKEEHRLKVKEMIETTNLLQLQKDEEMAAMKAAMERKHRDEVERIRREGEEVNAQLKRMRQQMVDGKGIVAQVESETVSPVSDKVNKRRSMPDVDEEFMQKYGIGGHQKV
mmetsp:Transcript_21566/g.44995  ORF Transcript_21566/g.44995 Transcript_21566/m.44995 type:complete len:737 (+) Transcript_21566:17-2227(+)